MERFLSYIGIAVGSILVLIAIALGNALSVSVPSPLATTTITVLPSIPGPSIPAPTVPALAIATSSPRIPPAPHKKPPVVSIAAPTPIPLQTQTVNVSSALASAADTLRAALVNILCYAPAGSGLTSISGSGVTIDPKGIILTNAHVAQYFLLADRGVSCTIRTGSPAANRYLGALEFISPGWIDANASVLTEVNPVGTGERDFALVAITKSATSDPLPASFPYVPLSSETTPAGTPIVIGSYGAQFLESNQIVSALFPTLVYGSVRTVYTFDTNTIDVLDLGGSAAAQEGSSGGGVVSANGKLLGTIVTSTVDGQTSARQLDAITASYMRSDYAKEMGQTLDTLIQEPTATALADFAPRLSPLEAELTANLPH